MKRIKNPRVARKNRILKGYAAFNDGDWVTLEELLSKNVEWHPMGGGPPERGRENVLRLLRRLRREGTEAELIDVANHGNSSITLDFTTGGREGDHACADKIRFDRYGRIREVWHCSSGTHEHKTHAGHPHHDH